jgi:putative heme-binding domain-containing protein
VGPNLNSIKHRSAEEILVHMFDPNRDVPPQFVMHTVELVDGRVLSGLVVNETDSSVELQRAENARDTILRRDIESLVSSGKSLMPDGLEQKLTKQDVANL